MIIERRIGLYVLSSKDRNEIDDIKHIPKQLKLSAVYWELLPTLRDDGDLRSPAEMVYYKVIQHRQLRGKEFYINRAMYPQMKKLAKRGAIV